MANLTDPRTRTLLAMGYLAWTDLLFLLLSLAGWVFVAVAFFLAHGHDGSLLLPLTAAVGVLALEVLWLITLAFRAIFFILTVAGRVEFISDEAARKVAAAWATGAASRP